MECLRTLPLGHRARGKPGHSPSKTLSSWAGCPEAGWPFGASALPLGLEGWASITRCQLPQERANLGHRQGYGARGSLPIAPPAPAEGRINPSAQRGIRVAYGSLYLAPYLVVSHICCRRLPEIPFRADMCLGRCRPAGRVHGRAQAGGLPVGGGLEGFGSAGKSIL